MCAWKRRTFEKSKLALIRSISCRWDRFICEVACSIVSEFMLEVTVSFAMISLPSTRVLSTDRPVSGANLGRVEVGAQERA